MARHQHVRLRRFERMSTLKEYTVEKGLTDPRGWKVLDTTGQTVGQVRDLVIDTDRMAAAYLEVALDPKSFVTQDDRVILVPMSRAERDGSNNRLIVRDLTRSRITALFDARAAHEASFWESWWRDEESAGAVADSRDERLARDPREERQAGEFRHEGPVRSFGRTSDPADDETPRSPVPGPGESIRIGHEDRVTGYDVDEPRQGLPADTTPAYPRRSELDEPDPLEDPHYRRPPYPGERRRFDE